ncbi:cystathionine gamma-synthase [Hypoxylon crocopeplum]|nr:cystathionine gamma-synthase [Hypoxylon crocopeplum]
MEFVDASQTEFGQSLPPHGPHTITTHLPGWETAMKFRDGDMSVISRAKSVYPRFFPFGPSGALCHAITQSLKLPEGFTCGAFVNPDAWASSKAHATSKFRQEMKLNDEDLMYNVVDIAGIRFYLLHFHASKMMGAMFMWQHSGLGFSTRLAEYLLPYVEDSTTHVGEFPDGANPPPPSYLPETEAHELLRQRIAGLMMRACVKDYKTPVKPDDVYLYQTGMAAITRFHDIAIRVRPGAVAVFGAVFHSTYHIFEESDGKGIKHYGKCDDADIDDFEEYLKNGGECSYVFTEFPSNPIMVSVDLMRLRRLADKYGFFIAVDDTCASFCNIDVLPAADVVITSLTKAFSGYADVMAGSVVLNPNTPSYEALKAAVSQSFHNELFAGDAAHLLKNNDDYLARCAVYNRNAEALVAHFQTLADDPSVPVARVWYPPHSPGSANLAQFARRYSPEFPQPGYGCLFSVELDTLEHAARFYDALNVYHGPHFGAHLTIAMPYNAVTYGKEHPEHHASYGLKQEQIRIGVGLEDVEVLLRICRDAVRAMMEGDTTAKTADGLSGTVDGS